MHIITDLIAGWHSTEVAFVLLTSCPGFDSLRSRRFILDVAEIYRQRALLSIEWTVQKLINVDRTHLVLLSGTTKKRI